MRSHDMHLTCWLMQQTVARVVSDGLACPSQVNRHFEARIAYVASCGCRSQAALCLHAWCLPADTHQSLRTQFLISTSFFEIFRDFSGARGSSWDRRFGVKSSRKIVFCIRVSVVRDVSCVRSCVRVIKGSLRWWDDLALLVQ